MDAKNLIQTMRENLEGFRKQNVKQFSIEYIEKWVEGLSKFVEASPDEEPTEAQKKIQQREWEGQMAHYNAQVQSGLEGFRSTVAFAQAALKSSILINGGAAVAILAFIGHIWNKGLSSPIQNQISGSLILFFLGVLVSAMATATSYLTQVFYSELQDHARALKWRMISIVLILFSYIFFLTGGIYAYKAFTITPQGGVQTETEQPKNQAQ